MIDPSALALRPETAVTDDTPTVPTPGGHPCGDAPARARRRHWDAAYETPERVSWHQAQATVSLELIHRLGPSPSAAVVDVGGGASPLVDGLSESGIGDVTVLDLSGVALGVARRRLGSRAGTVSWVHADLLAWKPERDYDIWHDGAVLHFMVHEAQREGYRSMLHRALRPGGHVVLGVFGPEGPERCSGLPVRRYGPGELAAFLGAGYRLEIARVEEHATPAGAGQRFTWTVFRRCT